MSKASRLLARLRFANLRYVPPKGDGHHNHYGRPRR